MADVGLLASVLTFAVAAGSPGPATLAVSGTAMARGARSGVGMALGLTLGLAAWGLLAGLGFGALVARIGAALVVLKLIGGAYLLYLAWKMARSAMTPGAETADPVGGRNALRSGVILNLGNPKAVLVWVAVLGLSGQAEPLAVAATVAACTAAGAAIYLAYALIFSRAPVMAFYRRQRRRLEAGFAALFGLAGLRLLLWRGTPG